MNKLCFPLVALSALLIATAALADDVKDLFLSEIDPGGSRGMVVNYYSELTSTEQSTFDSLVSSGGGYLITPTVVAVATVGGNKITTTSNIYVGEISSTLASALDTNCTTTCPGQCETHGCLPRTDGGGPYCSTASCIGASVPPCGTSPQCTKATSTASSAFLKYVP